MEFAFIKDHPALGFVKGKAPSAKLLDPQTVKENKAMPPLESRIKEVENGSPLSVL